MPALAVSLSVEGKRCVILGGGAVALRRASALLGAGAAVIVIAPHIDPALAVMPIEAVPRLYQSGDLAGAFLVVIATDQGPTNEAAAAEATRRGILVNRADDGEAGDLRFPASARLGPITVSVDTDAGLPGAAAAIRGELMAALDPGWADLLDIAVPFRDAIRQAIAEPDRRRGLIRRLTDHDAVSHYRSRGPGAYRAHCQSLLALAFAPILA
jgi:precorrin-2 dehydrogenase/sirohydrochlorin ferrochelatase